MIEFLKGNVYAGSVIDEELDGVDRTIAIRLKYPYINYVILSELTNLNIVIELGCGSILKAIVK